ncbi:MAG: hypothetical protein UHI81_08085 [Olegusella sp.]|nr:hypothetical protein [Olegusella sp.]MEE1274446.1 hypothetical protein [Olegusella sp.]
MSDRIDVHYRLPQKDADLVAETAGRLGISKTDLVSTAVRAYAAATSDNGCEVLVVNRNEWPLIRLEINRIGLNLNQGVTALNRCAKVLREAREYGYWSKDEIRGVGLSMREAADGIGALRGELTVLSKAVDRASGMPTVIAAKGRQRHARP